MKHFDVIVIGGGSAGLTTAIGASKAGKKVMLIEKNKTGGECTWSGCIPSKALISLSKKKDTADTFQKVRAISEKLYEHESPEVLKDLGVHFIKADAKFMDSKTVSVKGTNYTANNIVIATGSIPNVPNIKGIETVPYLTNQTIFQLDSIPKNLVFIGGGVISLELSMALSGLGVSVTILEQTPKILGGEDDLPREKILEIYKQKNINILTEVTNISVGPTEDEVLVNYTHGGQVHTIITEKIFVSAGRKPDIDSLNLAKAGIEYTKYGITVNKYLQTNQKNIYAIGDATGPFRFSHIAGSHGETMVRNLIFPFIKKPFKLNALPWVIFMTPEYARCGMNIKEASKAKIKHTVYEIDAKHLERAIVSHDEYFFLRVLTHKDQIIGAYCLGERAGEIISFFQFMIDQKIPLYKMMNGIFPYPTYLNGIRALGKQAMLNRIFNHPIVKLFKK